MEAAPRLPMLSFDLKVCTENTHFGPQLKQYIASFYHEDPDSYLTEIHNLESLRAAAVRPTMDVNGVQLLKKYYCQLHFLKSRFPMEENKDAAVQFSWKDQHLDANYTSTDIGFELMAIMYNIGALHSYLGSSDTRSNPEGMKMACTHFQCAAWAFQTVKEKYHQFVICISLIELVHFFQQVSLAQAQECILEKSMLDNRKATIIAKVAVQVHQYYRQSLSILESASDDLFRDKTYKEWIKHLQFKLAYYKCISLLYQGQQAEEQQKMGERVAFYQLACEQLEEAKRWANSLKNQQSEIQEGLAFTQDVVEGKRKAAKNENEFIYHESVPDKDRLEEVKGASLVKGIPFSINDTEVSGPHIFARLVPMEAHEAASLYSEKKAQMLRNIGELIETKDQQLAEFMTSLQLDLLTKMHQATGIPQELIDRAAALSAKPTAIQDLVGSMGKLSNIYQEVESSLNEIDQLLKLEEESEKGYQEIMGKRPSSIIATDLSREAAKYREAHSKANDSNQALHRAMTAHVANLKVLQQPLKQLQQQLPFVELPNANIDENSLKDLEMLVAKVDEMKTQRAMLWAQLRESVHQDDITNSLVTKQPNQSLEQLFQQELQKHQQLTVLIEQNTAAQENVKTALVDTYAQAVKTRKYVQDIIHKRNSMISLLVTSYDSYDDLLAKANKGIEFYTKLETNVSKLLQRIKSASKVQQEEREQMLLKNDIPTSKEVIASTPAAPKLKDYLESRKKNPVSAYPDVTNPYPNQNVNYGLSRDLPPGVRPAPLGSEFTDSPSSTGNEPYIANVQYGYSQIPPSNTAYPYPQQASGASQVDQDLAARMSNLLQSSKVDTPAQNFPTYSYSNYIPQNYATNSSYRPPTQSFAVPPEITSPYDPAKAYTNTTNTYRPLSSYSIMNNSNTQAQYSDSTFATPTSTAPSNVGYSASYQYPSYSNTEYSQPAPTPSGATQSLQPSVDTYYPQGYAPNQNVSQPSESPSFPENVQYHSLEYSTSVKPDQVTYNYNTFYSSPAANLSSTHVRETKTPYYYPSTSSSNVPTSMSYTPASTQADSSYQRVDSNIPTYSSNVANYGTAYLYPGTQSQAAAVPTYSGGQFYQDPQKYSQQTGTEQQAVSDQYSQYYASMSQAYPDQYYQQPSGAVAGQQSDQTRAPATYVQQNQQAASTGTQVNSTESNIDLLSGLDFTISQAPLVPQQNVAKLQPSEVNAASSDTKLSAAKPASAKEMEVVEIKRPSFKILPSKPLTNADVKRLFEQEVEKYEKFVETLTIKTLSGPTNLDVKWKEIQDKQECDAQRRIISVARCYPMKNRFPDILPYDYSRIELHGTKDDYINASIIKDISLYAPAFIVTQAPLSSTIGDFWTMIREQQVELIFCIMGDKEIEDVYWPKEKGQSMSVLNMVITLQSVIVKSHWTERLIAVNLPEKRDSRVVMHLQFTSWPGSLFPTTTDPFVSYVLELIGLFQQQRCPTRPVLVHCASGSGRSGLACLLTAAILDVANNANVVPDLAALASKVGGCRRNALRDREHLKFAYECWLGYMKQVVSQDKMKRRMNEPVPMPIVECLQPTDVVETNQDPLSTLDPFWASKK
ncbi:unnamed protein product [Phaedon cochleariae]|uniref:Tyrosine-protein phosphatase non-receptor type 23 n=1 Tax=Phaedon cochleariae TaxID=80249 RepID=A0A9N9SQ01_PHACE|nr:unnamed protein product [Phaedon cochleariae]